MFDRAKTVQNDIIVNTGINNDNNEDKSGIIFSIFDTDSDAFKAISNEDRSAAEELNRAFRENLLAAVNDGNPAGALAQKACELHKQWLFVFWGALNYTKEAHCQLGDRYVSDLNLKAYFDELHSGTAEFFKQALNIYCSDKENVGLGSVLESMGDYESQLGQIEKAEEHYENALELYEKEGNNIGLAHVFHSLGELESRLGQIDDAVKHYIQAGEIFQEEHDNIGLANVLRSMGDLKYRYGQIEVAQRYYSHAEELYSIERSNGLADLLHSLGELDISLGMIDTAREHFGKAEKLFRDQNDQKGLAHTLFSMGNLESRERETSTSSEYYAKAAELYCEEQDNLGLANVLLRMGDQECKLGHYEMAANYLNNAFMLYNTENDSAGKCYSLGALCRTYSFLGNVEETKNTISKIKEYDKHTPKQIRPYLDGCIKESLERLNIPIENI